MQQNPIISLKNVHKSFGGVSVLNGVDFDLQKGSVHALVGQNGAGKSTMMKILTGVYTCDSGAIYIDGSKVKMNSYSDAVSHGISLIFQELSLIPTLTVAENIFLNREILEGPFLDKKSMERKAHELLQSLDIDVDVHSRVEDLDVGVCQMIEIAKALSVNAKVLILDEPTASLSEKETAHLFTLINSLKQRGVSMIYISHRMAEIFEICDRVTVFKDGTYVTTMDTGDICADDIIRAMVGRELGNLYPTKSSCIAADDPVLEVNGLTGSIFREVSFALRRGEILGFAGLVGAGRSEVMRGLCAIDPIRSGQVVLNGRPCAFHTYRDAVDAGICYLTEDRKTQGLFLEMSIKNNMSSANMKGVSHGIWLDDKLERSLANRPSKFRELNPPSAACPAAISRSA